MSTAAFRAVGKKSTWSTADIDKQRYRLQMPGVNAGPGSTKMIDRQSCRNRRDEMLVSPAVGSDRARSFVAFAKEEATITSSVAETLPKPTLVNRFALDISPKPNVKRKLGWTHRAPPGLWAAPAAGLAARGEVGGIATAGTAFLGAR